MLRRNGAQTSADLQHELAVSQPTLSRVLSSLGDSVARIGRGRSSQYALRREVAGLGSSWPLFDVGEDGRPALLGRLHALARDQYWFDGGKANYPLLSDGLPYFVQDLTPQGFIGRTLPSRFPELGLPGRISDWNDDHVIAYLCQRGEDCIGNLMLGDESLQRFFKQSGGEQKSLTLGDRPNEYPALADAAIAGSVPGSSAGGEHPKFTTSIRVGGTSRHVLVKFSPAGNDSIAQRWSDLLICEYIAGHMLREANLTSTTAELLFAKGRTFLEVRRFDRTDKGGRIGVVSLGALANRHLGRRETWASATAGLANMGVISRDDAETVRRVATFGRLIANTDMHFGNLSFYLAIDGPMSLAPIYDMLPMFYAPVAGDQLARRNFEVPLPIGENLDIWPETAALAQSYWEKVASHESLSKEFADAAKLNVSQIRDAKKIVQ